MTSNAFKEQLVQDVRKEKYSNSTGLVIECKTCEHKKWEDGDPEICPPGYGNYYCGLTKRGAIPDKYLKEGKPDKCPCLRGNKIIDTI